MKREHKFLIVIFVGFLILGWLQQYLMSSDFWQKSIASLGIIIVVVLAGFIINRIK